VKTTLLGLKRTLGWRLGLTLFCDSIFWGSLVAAPFAPIFVWVVVAGAAAISMSAASLGGAPPSAEGRLPLLWFLPVALLPVTSFAAVHTGVWRIGSPRCRLRFRLGVSLLVAGLALGTASERVDRYLGEAGLTQVEVEASDYLQRSLKKASLTLLVARGLDGVISVLESFTVSAFAGVSPGEVLEPVDDLVERFSFVMLVATASLSAQLLLLEVGSAIGLTVFLTAALGVLLVAVWIPHRPFAQRLFDLAYKLALLAVVIRVGIPAAAVVGASVSERFLHSAYRSSSEALKTTADELRLDPDQLAEVPPIDSEDEKSFWQRFRQVTGAVATVSMGDIQDRLAALEAKVAELSEHIIRLLAIFVLEAMIFPLLVAWGLLKLLSILGSGARRGEGLPGWGSG